MMNPKRTMTSLVLLFTLFQAFPQNVISWKFSLQDKGNGEIELVADATIQQGWHMYDSKIPDNGPYPTSLSFDELKGAEVLGDFQSTGYTPSFINEIKIKGYSEKTILNRKKILEKFLKKYDFPDKISTYNFLSEIKVSKNSMSTYATYIRVFAKYWQDSTNDIFKLPEVTKMSKKEKTYLTKAELNKLISSTENDRDSLIIEFLANTGLRIGELTKLTKKDFDFENNVVKVCGKGDKERTVPLNTEIAKKIKEYIEKNEC